jgi:hypothetical protein
MTDELYYIHLTWWKRVLLEKPIAPQVIEKVPAFSGYFCCLNCVT